MPDISCYVHGLWLDQTGHAGIIDSEHVSNIQKPGLSCWHEAWIRQGYFGVRPSVIPNPFGAFNPSKSIWTETYLSLRSSSSIIGPTKHLWNHHPTMWSKMRLTSWHKKPALRNAMPGYWRPVVLIALRTWPRHPPRAYPGPLQSLTSWMQVAPHANVSPIFSDIKMLFDIKLCCRFRYQFFIV